MFVWRRLVTVVLSCVEVVEPKFVKRTPPAPPSIHNFVPLVLTAPRGFDPVAASVNAVVVSTVPLASTRAIIRLTVEELEEVMLAVPGAASYPVAVKYRPSVERANSPSDVADPLAVNVLLLPLAAVGSAI